MLGESILEKSRLVATSPNVITKQSANDVSRIIRLCIRIKGMLYMLVQSKTDTDILF